jgi:hypothetical protein
MESIKKILGLPSQASVKQIESRLCELMAKEEELEGLKSQTQKETEPAKGWSWWRRRCS